MTEHKKRILVTGGAGYIGSHTTVELLNHGYFVTIVDNLDNGSLEAVNRVRDITKCSEDALVFKKIDLLDFKALEDFFKQQESPFTACIHFAGLKAVGESVKLPLHYYHNNLTSTLYLLSLLDKYSCHAFVFSSSATVYGDPDVVPIPESHKINTTNPYGGTKAMIEQFCTDLDISSPKKWSIALLRYFNPIGAHPSGRIGEDPQGYPNNLLPFVAQVAVGRREKVSVFGSDYDTVDGTGVRDYIHVTDLARGHVASLEKLINSHPLGVEAYNLGTGKGVSVLQVIEAFSKACGKTLDYELSPRRPGDIAVCYADPAKASKELNWTAEKGIDEMCRDAWNWQSNNPFGFRSEEEVRDAEDTKDGKQRDAQVFHIMGNS